MEGCNCRNISPINLPKYHRGKVYVFVKKLSKSTEFYYLEPGLNRSITDIVEAMKALIQERHNHRESCITAKVSEIHLANERSGFAFFSMDLGQFFGSNVSNKFQVMLRRKGPHKPELANDIVRIHYLMIYTDLIENNNV